MLGRELRRVATDGERTIRIVLPRIVALVILTQLLVACFGPAATSDAVSSTLVPPDARPASLTATSQPIPTEGPAQTETPRALPSPSPTSTPVPTPAVAIATETISPSPTAGTGQDVAVPDASGKERPLVIVLDPGHDRTSPGALGIEYQVVLDAAFIAKDALEAAGYQVHLTREDNDFVFADHPELLPPNAADMHPGYGMAYAHATKALEFEPDLILILHFNGHPNPDVRGIEVYYCEMGGPQNLVLAEIITEELVDALQSIGYNTPSTRIAEDLTVARGNRHFPSMGNVYDPPTHWVENRYAGIPVVLTEPLYMTNPIERPLLDDDATHEAIADAYVRAVDRYFGR